MRCNRARSLIFRACAVFLALTVSLSGAGAALCEEAEAPFFDALSVTAPKASGTLLSAEEVVLDGKTGGVRSLCTFSGAKGRLLISITEKYGYEVVRTGDGTLFSAWKLTGSTGSICALTRLGTTHLAAVSVMARQTSWDDSRPDEEKILWVNAYNSYRPAIVPASTQRHMVEHGDVIAYETGFPGATVELLRDGEAVTTATADETGSVIFDVGHAADGRDHYVSAVYTFGNYDYRAATAYASDPANLTEAGGGTGYEWVNGNDCATYGSRILTAGGFPIYAPYTNSSSSPGGSVRHTLVSLTGEDYFKTEFTIDDFHEGDIAWGHNMGHVMYCKEVNREENTVYVYAHSTRANDPLTDNGWVSIADLNAVIQLVTEESSDYEYRIGGVINPLQIVFEREPGGERETRIVSKGASLVLPECPFASAEHTVFLGWLANGALLQPGEEVTAAGPITFTAQWKEDILLGIADLVLPAFVRRIEESAFEQSAAESVYLPDSCELIGPDAFRDCANLRRIRIPKDCALDETAFDGCSGVTVYGVPGSPAEQFCAAHEGFRFIAE